MYNKGKSKAQTLLEFAIIIAAVSAFLVAMQIYTKRGLQGRVKDLTDHFIGKRQYSSGLSKSQYEAEMESRMHKAGAGNTVRYEISESSKRGGREQMVNDEDWQSLLPAK